MPPPPPLGHKYKVAAALGEKARAPSVTGTRVLGHYDQRLQNSLRPFWEEKLTFFYRNKSNSSTMYQKMIDWLLYKDNCNTLFESVIIPWVFNLFCPQNVQKPRGTLSMPATMLALVPREGFNDRVGQVLSFCAVFFFSLQTVIDQLRWVRLRGGHVSSIHGPITSAFEGPSCGIDDSSALTIE